MSKKRSNKTRIPPDVAAQYFSHLSSSSSNVSGNSSGNNNGRSNGNPPCSPEEVKALMSMFAEIMGMADSSSAETTTTTTRRSKTTTTTSSSSVSFMFGSNSGKDSSSPSNWPPNALAAAARAASMYMPPEGFMDYDDDDEDDDDDDYNDEEDEDHQHKSNNFMSTSSTDSKGPSTIDPNDWKELEQVANDEVREQQDRARKAAKKREKKQRKKERARQEAALKAAEAAKKKHDKLVTSWKSRVVSAASVGDTSKLNALLKESPLKVNDESNQEHIDFLFPNCVAKTQDAIEKSSECRLKLAEFCVSITASTKSSSIFMSILKSGRSALHSACFVGDYYFVEFVLEHITTNNSDNEEDDCCDTEVIDWNATCRESGFAPIHYAVLSGSEEVLELLLGQEGCNVDCKTNAALTNREGREVTALDLAKALLDGKQGIIQSSGSAWSEANGYCAEDRFRYHSFLQGTIDRLTHVLRHGYTPLANAASRENIEDQGQKGQQDIIGVSSSNNKSRKKKKKKKQQQQQQQRQQQQQLQATPVPVVEETKQDPMISALLGMGFSTEQINRAAEACGGTARATADDLVQWIFAQEAGEEPPAMSTPLEQPARTQPDNSVTVPVDNSTLKAEHDRADAFQKAEEARLAHQRLVQKREEQRRRNREWNNREQARQREEAQAKLRARSTYNQGATNTLAGANGIHQAPQGAATSLHHLNNSISGEVQLPVNTISPNPSGAPIKILTRAKNTNLDAALPTAATSNPKKHPQTLVENIGPEFSHVSTTAGNFSEDATVSSLGSGMVTASDWTNEHENISNDGGLAGFQAVAVSNLAPSSAPPPGFQFGGAQTSPETSFNGNEQFVPDTNPTGEIRATARAFIPSSFKQPPGLVNNSTPGNSAVTSGSVAGSTPFELSGMAKTNSSPAPLLNDPVATLLPSGLQQQQKQSFVPLNGFERKAPVTGTPFAADSSSITGIATTTEEPFATNQVQGAGLHSDLGLGSLSRGPEPAAPIGSLLDPLVLQGSSNVETPTIWGSGSNQPSGNAASTIGGLPSLNEGLPSLSSFGAFDNNNDKKNTTNEASSNGWGDTNASSIW
eukprot:CAMPEP_0178905982 /NCGR_PEP_ID=MMETSP0786-20121207/6578_1 /TAXON_ID=186022 /ORGANISM="Thalassionema frauenfeldii, Strain CCMP 1798" /LENGTH=1082 /DNA_ID=CAMNT_0020577651 /DNA_START=152 /DNA_END=3400 /DNA_ORIENTATION=-